MGGTRRHMCKRCSDQFDEFETRLNLSDKDGALIKLLLGDSCDICSKFIRSDHYALTNKKIAVNAYYSSIFNFNIFLYSNSAA
ncbi:unnamed protein product [Rotaria sp. Silwood2]|nr:unnamed protein product [Rotaria sp. Silwood2]